MFLFRSEKAEEYLDEFLPDLTAFCTYVKKWMQISASQDEEIDPQETAVKMMEREFICQQLVDLAQIFDLSDEVTKNRFVSFNRIILFFLENMF